jgi:hypothetical protein
MSNALERYLSSRKDSDYYFTLGGNEPPMRTFTDLWDDYSDYDHADLIADWEIVPLEVGKRFDMLFRAGEVTYRVGYGVIVEMKEGNVTIQFDGFLGLREFPIDALKIKTSPKPSTVHCILREPLYLTVAAMEAEAKGALTG